MSESQPPEDGNTDVQNVQYVGWQCDDNRFVGSAVRYIDDALWSITCTPSDVQMAIEQGRKPESEEKGWEKPPMESFVPGYNTREHVRLLIARGSRMRVFKVVNGIISAHQQMSLEDFCRKVLKADTKIEWPRRDRLYAPPIW